MISNSMKDKSIAGLTIQQQQKNQVSINIPSNQIQDQPSSEMNIFKLQAVSLQKCHDVKQRQTFQSKFQNIQQLLQIEQQDVIVQSEKIVQEDENKQKQQQIQQTNQRRSRNDNNLNRNFVCGCGKDYLSYPALYTHIRTKHDGVPPQGTKSSQNMTSKRGRPRREDERFNYMDMNKDLYNNQHSDKRKEGLAAIYQNLIDKNDFKIFDLVEENYFGNTDLEKVFGWNNQGNDDQNQSFYNKYKKLINEILKGQINEELNRSSPCDLIICIFLINISKLIKMNLFQVILIFFKHLRDCLNQIGYQQVKALVQKKQYLKVKYIFQKVQGNASQEHMKRGDKQFSEIEGVEYIPYIAEYFIINYLPQRCKTFDQSFAIYFMIDFCNWLSKRNFALVKVEIFNSNYIELSE